MFKLHFLVKIPDYPKYLLDAAQGELYSEHRGKFHRIKPFDIGKRGQHYYAVKLYNENGVSKTLKLHQIVVKSCPDICGEWFEGAVVNHKDENTANNSCFNLEACTIAYNNNYGTRNQRVFDSNVKNGRYSGYHAGTEEYRNYWNERMKKKGIKEFNNKYRQNVRYFGII